MKTRSSHYPIGKLLIETLAKSGLSIQPFVLAIGYGNSSKGVRAFDQMLKYGVPDEVFLGRLNTSSFAPTSEELDCALEESKKIVDRETQEQLIAQREEERRAFRPFVQGIPEYTTPTSITFFCFTGGHSRYTHSVPEDLPTWDESEQHRHVKEVVSKHFTACNGRTLWMGKITGYRLFRRYGEPAVVYTTSGEPVGTASPDPLPKGELSIGGKTLDPDQVSVIFKAETFVSEPER